jgi:hypothetical protein
MIINYQAELRQINDAIRKLEPVSACGTAQQAQSPVDFNAYYKG